MTEVLDSGAASGRKGTAAEAEMPSSSGHRLGRRLLLTTSLAVGIALAGGQLADATPASRLTVSSTVTNFYVSATGSDSNAGTSAAVPWRTVARVNSHTLRAGESVLFRRGDTFADAGLVIDDDGTSAARISVGSYGSGAVPVFDGGGTDRASGTRTPIVIRGDYVSVRTVRVQHSQYAGIDLFGTDARVSNSVITRNPTGIQQNRGANRAKITSNTFSRNSILVIGPGSNDDYGAQALALGGANADVSGNFFSGNYNAGSPDYGVDGAAIEVYGSVNADIHHNKSTNDLIFVELGNLASGTLIHDNLLYSTVAAAGGVNIHGSGSYGGVTGTRLLRNSFVLTAADSMAFVADGRADCELRNNILTAASAYSERPVDEAGNVWTISDYQGVNSVNSSNSRGLSPTSVATVTSGLISPASGNFHLLSTSPAIDRSVSSSLTVSGDFDGVSKSGTNWDVGALEYVG